MNNTHTDPLYYFRLTLYSYAHLFTNDFFDLNVRDGERGLQNFFPYANPVAHRQIILSDDGRYARIS